MVSMDGPAPLKHYLCGILLGLLACGHSQAAETEGEADIPEGFEDIDAPRETAVEVWFAGQKLGAFAARFTSRWIEFADPADLVNPLRSLTDKAPVIQALTGQLDAHASVVCQKQRGEACPVIYPEVAGVIFNATAFQAQLFIHPSLQKVREQRQKRYLGDASSNFSAIQGLGLTVSGARGEKSTHHYSLYGRSLAAWQENHLFADWRYDKTSHFTMTSLYGERDWQGQTIQAGLFTGDSTGLTFTADPGLIGLRVAHSSSTLNQNVSLSTTPVIVYLPVRGRVEIYRNDTLLEARMLEAGRQQLDTRTLPQGAYNLTVKIYDGATLLDTQKRLFVKSNRLPGLHDPLYFFELGRPALERARRVWPGVQQGWLARGGYSFLLRDNTALSLAASVRNSDALAEAGLIHIGPWADLSAGVMLARYKRRGIYSEARVQLGKGQLLANYRALNPAKRQRNSGLLARGSRTGQLTYDRSLRWGTLSFGSDWQKHEDDRHTLRTDHISLTWNLIDHSRMQLRFALEGSRNRNSRQVLASLVLTHKSGPRSISLQHNRQDVHSKQRRALTQVNRAAVRWQNMTVPDAVLGGGVVTGGLYAERQRQQRSVGLDGRLTGRQVGAQLSVNRSWASGRNTVTSYTGSLGTSILANPEQVFIGGGHVSDSGVLVHLQGKGSGQFDIQVDGRTVTRARIGESVPVVLSPFREYQIGIASAGDSFSDYEDRLQTVVLYPGNVAQVSFTATTVEPVLGVLVTPVGEPLAKAVIENSTGKTVTDQNGFFQARLAFDERQLAITRSDGRRCQVVLPESRAKKRGVTLFGRLTCKLVGTAGQPLAPWSKTR